MARRFVIVMKDRDKAVEHRSVLQREVTHAQHVEQKIARGLSPKLNERQQKRVEEEVAAVVHSLPAAGDPVSFFDFDPSECPDGNLKCEHCGEFDQRDACRAAGHCENCITIAHGCIPKSVIDSGAYELVELVGEQFDLHESGEGMWDRPTKRFVKRPPKVVVDPNDELADRVATKLLEKMKAEGLVTKK